MSSALKHFFLWDIVQGMSLTLKVWISGLFDPFKKPADRTIVTRRYPKVKRPAEPGFRGLHALAKDEKGHMKCVGCGMCAAICPSKCIHIHTAEGPDNKKYVTGYRIEVLRCVYCALCVEACPYGAVVLTEHYEYANYSRKDFDYDMPKLLANWDKYMAGEKGRTYFEKFWGPKKRNFEGGGHAS
jgi:NADH-quinone oxidoreductase subunit I